MVSKIEGLIRQAVNTFQSINLKSSEEFLSELSSLVRTVSSFSLKDVNIPKHYMVANDSNIDGLYRVRRRVDAVSHVDIYEDAIVTIGIFVLKQGARIPLHDHPLMYGIIKVLHGKLKVSSYSISDPSLIMSGEPLDISDGVEVIKHPDIIVTPSDETCTLTPYERNFHEITCLEGPAAFLDVLSPPYEDDQTNDVRGCHYFRELDESSEDSNKRQLEQIACPYHLFIHVGES